MAYAIAQLLYSLVLFIQYSRLAEGTMKEYFKFSKISEEEFPQSLFIKEHLSDMNEFSRICALKFILTEGEKIVITYLTAANSSGELASQAAELSLISNLISIVCRFILHPLEEIALNLFAKFKMSDSKVNIQENQKVIETLTKYLAGVLGVGVSAIIFSRYCSGQFLLLVYSEKWATETATEFMKAYCIYLCLMALNGMSEAFAYGLANQEVLRKLQGMLLFNSCIYVAAVVFLT
jgi:oligosaccharide translocation protein RFT1